MFAATATAQPAATSTEPMIITAASSTIDDATNTADFRQIIISQGARRLTADSARTTGLDFRNSQWTLVGQVVFSLDPRSSLWADHAVVAYQDGKLAQVAATGSPSHFEQRRTDPRPPQRGEADVITYDPELEIVHLQGHAWVSDGEGTEIRAPLVVYYLREHTWHADAGTAAPTVRIKPMSRTQPPRRAESVAAQG